MDEQTYVQHTIEDACWERIFKLVKENDPDDFTSVSLVCKKFLSVTNQMKTSLAVTGAIARHLPTALIRFRHIKRICIDSSFHSDVESLFFQISRSRLEHLEALEILHPENFPRESLRELALSTNGLKKLKLVGISLCDDDLILLSELFPCLEELYLDCFKTYEMVTDRGVKLLSLNLRKLKKASLCNFSMITDIAIICLSANCKDLTSLEIQYCQLVTENGIGFLLLHSFELTSLTIVFSSGQSFSNDESQFTIDNTISDAKNLEEIQLWGVAISDDLLSSIAKLRTSVKKIDIYPGLASCYFTILGLITLVSECSLLKSFSLRGLPLDDQFMFDLCVYLRGLTSLNLHNCSPLTCASFFSLTQYCPFLESLVMDGTRVGFYEDVDLVLDHNNRIKYLSMKSCELLNDLSLFRFVLVCPYLESLEISDCGKLTGDGISRVLKSCPEIRQLNIGGVKVSNFLGLDSLPFKLRSIQADGTQINDEVMGDIGETCPELEELNIACCDQVTEFGVRLLVSKCRKLKKINMQQCKFSSIELLDWMMANRPSLKEIVPPSGFIPSEERRNSFLANGCLLLNGGQS